MSQLNATALGVDVPSKQESQIFRWMLACLLFGKPIQQEIAKRAYETLLAAGVTSLDALLRTDWNTLVELLDKAHYVHYDFSTATKLREVGGIIKARYGSVLHLIEQVDDIRELEGRLLSIKGIGPVTAGIFMKEITPVWFSEGLTHDFDSAVRAAAALNDHGYDAYIVGGAVRDLWLGRHPKDFDLVTNATPEQIMAIAQFQKSKYNDPAQAFGVTRVKFVHKGITYELEIATFRKDIDAHLGRKATRISYATLEDDVLRRDFTINALALDPSTNYVIDYVGGIEDLNNKLIRFIGSPKERIREDPLRIMRAVRFKNHLGFSYYPQITRSIIKAVADGYIEKIAIDRLRDELTNLLIHSTRHQAIMDLDVFGILERILPEVTAGKITRQPPEFHAEGDVWQHELLILDYLPHTPSKRLAWAALLHDIGKPVTISIPRVHADRIRFNRHYAVGAEMAKTVLRRLKFSHHDISDITWMIYHHMAIDDLPLMRPSKQQQMLGHPAFEDLLDLHRADAASSWRPGQPPGARPQFKEIERLWHAYQSKTLEQKQPSLKRDVGIDGRWLIEQFGEEFGFTAGPIVGKVLDELEEWYQDEGATDKHLYEIKARTLLQNYRHTAEDAIS